MVEVAQTVQSRKVGSLGYLTLDYLDADPRLARCLPLDLAWRYHALPLADENGHITVAMAHPEDAEAREAVVAALGPSSCVVKGSALAIDAWLTDIWRDETRTHLQARVCDIPDPFPEKLWDYVRALGGLLGARLGRVRTESEVDALLNGPEHTWCDLVIMAGPARGKRCDPLIRRWLSRPAAAGVQALEQRSNPSALLVIRQPRWPLERLLLVICSGNADDAAVDWTLRLARPGAAAVTALAVVPPVPAMYHGLPHMEQGVAALLAADTILGRQMHHVARRLAQCKVEGTLRLRQGAPSQQICREVAEGGHDLIIMATRTCPWWLRQLKGDPICSLLSRVDRPVLLAEPSGALARERSLEV
jgi:nucleotide-binding universal stress UspA family protein